MGPCAAGWQLEGTGWSPSMRTRAPHQVRLPGPSGAGPPGLARRLTALRPAMTHAGNRGTTRIYRVAGRTGGLTALITA
jgi:hypothetical protein